MKCESKMQFTLGILCWATTIFMSLGQKNPELVTTIFNDPIELTLSGIIKVYANVTIHEILATTNNEFEQKYIDARLETSNGSETRNLTLFTTERFANYAREQTATRISLKIQLGCGMGKERVLIFFQPLKEGNYFRPIFSKTLYELTVPTPIFAGFDLTTFVEITARDDDLTHNRILFTSNDSWQYYIAVGTGNVTTTDKKTYFANLILEKILLDLPQPIEFEIVATDSGDPPKNATATVVIRADPKRSLPPKPKFTRSLYKGFIDLDFNMQPIQAQLLNGTYTPEVEFYLDDVAIRGFYVKDYENGTVDIMWNTRNLNKTDMLKLKMLEFGLKAEHVNLAEMGSANILIEMIDIKNYFNFMSSYYEGNLDEIGELHLSPIIFNPYTYQPDMQFGLRNFHEFFHLSVQNFSIQLQLNTNFTWKAIDNIGYLKLTVQASWEYLLATTNVVIRMPQLKTTISKQIFEFEKPLYKGHVNDTFGLELEKIILRTDVAHISGIEYKLSGDDSDHFFIMHNENHTGVEIKVSSNLVSQNEFKYKSFYLLILEAKHHDTNTHASVLINVPHRFNTGTQRNIFRTPFVQGSISIQKAAQQLSIEAISLVNHLEDQLNLHLTGEHSSHFDVWQNRINHKINITLKTPLTSNILATKRLLKMTLQAILAEPNGFTNDTLMIFIELPMKECPAIPTIQFHSSDYVFTIETNQTGTLGVVNAWTDGSTTTSIHYILSVPNDVVAESLSVNRYTGELSLSKAIEEGNYLFNITAENAETHESAVAKALLKVLKQEECRLFEGATVDKTLMVLEVDEEKPNYGVLDLKFNENCTFHIVDMWPRDKEYVHVNYIFTILDTISIDREDAIFQNMSEPHVKVKLRLKCDSEDQQRNLTIDIPQQLEKRSLHIEFTEDMPYAPDIMWLYIKINDINDNPPQFNVSEDPLHLGYPSGNAAFEMYPEYLTQIDAFDRDVGFNAKILFTMRDNPYFDIEPNTGKIYPKDKMLYPNEQTELIILATDQYGEGLVSGMVVLVKGLSPDFYSFITLKEYSARTKQQVENDLSRDTGYNINVLKMSYVPQMMQQRSLVNQTLSCKAWIYAYDNHQLVTYEKMQEQILVKNPEANILNMESYNDAVHHMPRPSPSHTHLNYQITSIVLALTSCSFLIFIIWRFCCKTSPTTKRDTKTSTVIDDASVNGNGQQQICSNAHNLQEANDYAEYNNHDTNQVKFSDLATTNSMESQ